MHANMADPTEEELRRRRSIRRTTVVLVVVVLAIYFGFIASGVLKSVGP
jgi:preprotein translocase subunit SecE